MKRGESICIYYDEQADIHVFDVLLLLIDNTIIIIIIIIVILSVFVQVSN